MHTSEHKKINLGITTEQVGYEVCSHDHSYGPSVRDYYLFHYVESGKGYFRYEDEEVVVGANQLFMIMPDEVTFYKADSRDPWTYYWFGINSMNIEEIIKAMGFDSSRRVVDYMLEESLLDQIIKLMNHRVEKESDTIFEASTLYGIIARLSKNYEVSDYYIEDASKYSSHYVRMAINYIHKKYTSNITIHDIAKFICIDRTQLYRLFVEDTGIGPQAYLINLRMECASHLLRTTDLPIRSIAYSVGYNDAYLFSKIFKQIYGMAPKFYRSKNVIV